MIVARRRDHAFNKSAPWWSLLEVVLRAWMHARQKYLWPVRAANGIFAGETSDYLGSTFRSP
jgi:hypothetical protein